MAPTNASDKLSVDIMREVKTLVAELDDMSRELNALLKSRVMSPAAKIEADMTCAAERCRHEISRVEGRLYALQHQYESVLAGELALYCRENA